MRVLLAVAGPRIKRFWCTAGRVLDFNLTTTEKAPESECFLTIAAS